MSIDELRPVRPGRDRPSASDHNTMIGLLRGLSRSSGGDVMVGPDGQISMRRRRQRQRPVEFPVEVRGREDPDENGMVPHAWQRVQWEVPEGESHPEWVRFGDLVPAGEDDAAFDVHGIEVPNGEIVMMRRFGGQHFFQWQRRPLRAQVAVGSVDPSARADHVLANIQGIGERPVAKPPQLWHRVGFYTDLQSMTTVDGQTVDVEGEDGDQTIEERWTVSPPYLTGSPAPRNLISVIWAPEMLADLTVTLGGQATPVNYLDLNIAGRRWHQVPKAT